MVLINLVSPRKGKKPILTSFLLVVALLSLGVLFYRKFQPHILRPLTIDEIEVLVLVLHRVQQKTEVEHSVIKELESAFLDVSNPPFLIKSNQKHIYFTDGKILVPDWFLFADIVTQENLLLEFINTFKLKEELVYKYRY